MPCQIGSLTAVSGIVNLLIEVALNVFLTLRRLTAGGGTGYSYGLTFVAPYQVTGVFGPGAGLAGTVPEIVSVA